MIQTFIKAGWLFLGLCLFVFLSGCKKQITSDMAVVSIDITSAKAKDLQGKVDIVEVVELEMTDASILRDISYLSVDKEYILTASLRQDKVCLWSRDGHFIRNIGQRGNGANEFLDLIDVRFDAINGKIYILDRLRQRMMVYGLDGNLLSNTYKGMWIDSFCKTEDGYWVYVPNNWPGAGYALMLLDNDFNEVKGEFFHHEAFFPSTMVSRFFKDDAGEYYFVYPFSNIIYHLKDDNPQPWLKIDFGENTLPYDEIRKMNDRALWDRLKSEKKYMGDIEELVICDGKIEFSYNEVALQGDQETYRVYYDTNDGNLEIYNNSTLSISVDTDNGHYPMKYLTLIEPFVSYGNLWIYIIEPSSLQGEDLELLREKVSPSISEDSNPLLFFVKQSM